MNPLWVSLRFFVLILAELTVLFPAIYGYVPNDFVVRLAGPGNPWRSPSPR